MKRLPNFVLMLMLSLLFSCNEKTEGGDATADGGKQKELLETNRKVLRAIETGDSATIRAHMADDAVDHGAGENGADLKGEEIITMLVGIHKKIDNLKFEVIEEAANDDHIFTYTRMTGTVKEDVWGMKAGTQADFKSVDMIKVNGDKMTDHWVFIEPAEMMKMMGGGKPADGPAKDTAQKQ